MTVEKFNELYAVACAFLRNIHFSVDPVVTCRETSANIMTVLVTFPRTETTPRKILRFSINEDGRINSKIFLKQLKEWV